jgi:hypothetical protein
MPQVAEIGCGDYTIIAQTRCAGARVCTFKDAERIRFNRVLNDISEAEITLALRGNCCECLGEIEPWAHEIAIYRDSLLVWVGPLIDIDIDQEAERATLYAKDLLAWSDHRVVEIADVDYEPEATDLADAFVWLLNHAYCKDPWCMTWAVDPIGVPVERWYPSFDKAGGDRWGGQYPTVYSELRTLTEGGVDYTVVGRHMWGGSVQVTNPSASNVMLLDSHFAAAPKIKVTGAKMGNRQIVAGGIGGHYGYTDDQIDMHPNVSGQITPALLDGIQQKYGLLETFQTNRLYDEVDTTDAVNAIGSEAKSRWDLLHRPVVYISSGRLHPSAPFTFEENLIPGTTVRIGVQRSCVRLTETTMRLYEVNVTVTPEVESIDVTFQPTGTTSTYLA